MSSWAFGSEYGPKTVQDTLEIARENSRRAPVAFVPGKRDPARGIPAVIEMIANDLQPRRVDSGEKLLELVKAENYVFISTYK